uniref:DUF4283 domain-containing protein n=1 Tax=Cannabis sativa TaxID=3483 RepID=A0A803NSP0_CANSA
MASGSHLNMDVVGRHEGEEDEYMLLLDDDEGDLSGIDDRWCLVGRFLTKRSIDFQAMQHKIASLWQPGRGMYVKELNPNHFLFQFYHEIDIARVIDGSPWTFDRAPLIFERLKTGENPRLVSLNRLEFWIQLHNMESGFMTEYTVCNVVNYIGTFVKSDPNNFVGVWRDFLRVRVSLNIDKPLKKKMKLEKKEWLFDTPPERIVKSFDLSLKATSRRRQHTIGAQWLRSGVAMKALGTAMPGSSVAIGNAGNPEITAGNQGIDSRVSSHITKVNATDFVGLESARGRFMSNDVEEMIMEAPGNNLNGKSMAQKEKVTTGGNKNVDSLLVLDSKRRRTFNMLESCGDNGPAQLNSAETISKDFENYTIESAHYEIRDTDVAQGLSGGLALYWKEKDEGVLLGFSNNHIDVRVDKVGCTSWRLTEFYGESNRNPRNQSWNLLRTLLSSSSLPWCLISDVNNILSQEDKKGGQPYPVALLEGFQKAIFDCQLVDMDLTGY